MSDITINESYSTLYYHTQYPLPYYIQNLSNIRYYSFYNPFIYNIIYPSKYTSFLSFFIGLFLIVREILVMIAFYHSAHKSLEHSSVEFYPRFNLTGHSRGQSCACDLCFFWPFYRIIFRCSRDFGIHLSTNRK
jgi:hypothetical protein